MSSDDSTEVIRAVLDPHYLTARIEPKPQGLPPAMVISDGVTSFAVTPTEEQRAVAVRRLTRMAGTIMAYVKDLERPVTSARLRSVP